MGEYRVVLVTAPSAEEARRLAVLLIDEGLAPCVNIVPACTSVYRWQDATHQDEEALMVIKTRDGSMPALAELIERSHPYEVPEILALPVAGIGGAYASYLDRFFEG